MSSLSIGEVVSVCVCIGSETTSILFLSNTNRDERYTRNDHFRSTNQRTKTNNDQRSTNAKSWAHWQVNGLVITRSHSRERGDGRGTRFVGPRPSASRAEHTQFPCVVFNRHTHTQTKPTTISPQRHRPRHDFHHQLPSSFLYLILRVRCLLLGLQFGWNL